MQEFSNSGFSSQYPSHIQEKTYAEESSDAFEQKEESFAQDYHIIRYLQSGGQATVYLASKDDELYALKIYHQGEKFNNYFQNEVKFLNRIQYKGLMKVVETIPNGRVKIKKQQEQHQNIIVMMYAENGDLCQWIKNKGVISEPCMRYVVKKIIETIRYLHTKYIYHRDLKPENILLGERYQPLVTDLGHSHDSRQKIRQFPGDYRYCSPQVLKHQQFTEKSQIFTLGITMFYLLFGQIPFGSARLMDQNYRIIIEKKYHNFWSKVEKKTNKYVSSQFKQLFINMIASDPKQRTDFDNILNFQWFELPTLGEEQYRNSMQKN